MFLVKNKATRRPLREKLGWVFGLVLFYAVTVFAFIVYPEKECRSVSLAGVIKLGPVTSFKAIAFNTPICQVLVYSNAFISMILLGIILLAITSGMHSRSKASYLYKEDPSALDTHLVMHIPCYSECFDELKKTIDSCVLTDYTDSKKLLFVVSDGLVTGAGNAKSTPEILVHDVFNCFDQNPVPQQYISTDLGETKINEAIVYCGFYTIKEHTVPYVLVIKCGTIVEEKSSKKPGNRGKRDSQLILYKYFHNTIFSSASMRDWEPLQIEIQAKFLNILRIDPSIYEHILVADADTYIYPDGVRQLVAFLECSPKHFGVCGETKIGNRTASFCAFTQAFEYFITHAILKAMENLCSDVLVLSGCYTIYRFRNYAADGSVTPCILHPDIITEYMGDYDKNLHEHNLLTIGEDRYLTVLALMYLPKMRNRYIPRAKCSTNAPVDISTLLSQRRRWTNSLIHCHIHLATRIFARLPLYRIPSLLFVMGIELYYIFMLPITIPFSIISSIIGYSTFNLIFVLCFTVGIPLVLTLVTLRAKQLLYCLAFIAYTPIYSIIIPLYSIWKMDDFGWGSTRELQTQSL